MAGKYMKNKYVFVLVMLLSILVVSFGFTNIYVSQHQQTEDEDFVVVKKSTYSKMCAIIKKYKKIVDFLLKHLYYI